VVVCVGCCVGQNDNDSKRVRVVLGFQREKVESSVFVSTPTSEVHFNSSYLYDDHPATPQRPGCHFRTGGHSILDGGGQRVPRHDIVRQLEFGQFGRSAPAAREAAGSPTTAGGPCASHRDATCAQHDRKRSLAKHAAGRATPVCSAAPAAAPSSPSSRRDQAAGCGQNQVRQGLTHEKDQRRP
jgi:hypothetical protein